METKARHVSEVPVSTGLPKAVANPIKPERFAGKHEAALGKAVGLTQFGVNLVTLEPGSMSSLRHWHEAEDEFVYVLEGEVVLVDNNRDHIDRWLIRWIPCELRECASCAEQIPRPRDHDRGGITSAWRRRRPLS